DIAPFLEALPKRVDEVCRVRERRAAEKPDDRKRRLLRANRERPSRRAAEQRHQLASSHCLSTPLLGGAEDFRARWSSRVSARIRWAPFRHLLRAPHSRLWGIESDSPSPPL